MTDVNFTRGTVASRNPDMREPSTRRPNLHKPSARHQRGFTVIELMVALVIMGILSALFFVNPFAATSGAKAIKTADSLMRFVAVTSAQLQSAGAAPYTSITTANLANAVRGDNVFDVTGTGAAATVAHQLGSTGSQITVSPGTIAAAGDSMLITLPNVDKEGCAAFTPIVAGMAYAVFVNGTGLKTTSGGVTSAFNGAALGPTCTPGTTNTISITVK